MQWIQLEIEENNILNINAPSYEDINMYNILR